jgi:biotin transport system substrate-specific component
MLRTLSVTYNIHHAMRLIGIVGFTLLIALGAQVEIWFGGPVPFTLQVLMVLLAGMVLGARDGAISVMLYLGFIAINLPIAAGGVGAVALTGTTVGYLVGFVPSAFVTGLLVERSHDRVWQRWVAGILGVLVIYALGVPVLKLMTGADSWQQAWLWGGYPFIGLDILKALIAATLTEGVRHTLLR